jgi:hypothetical protein
MRCSSALMIIYKMHMSCYKYKVVVTLVKHFQPLTPKCTCSLNTINFICANVCCSQSQQSSIKQIHVDSCDDLIAEENGLLKLEAKRIELDMTKLQGKTLGQPTQDNRDHMVNKLELETTITRSFSQQKYKSYHHKRQEKVKDLNHIKCFKCSDMGHYGFMCSAQVESKTRLSRRQRRHLRTNTYFRCKQEGHRVLSCSNFQAELHCSGKIGQIGMHNRSDRPISGLPLQGNLETSYKGPIASRTRQGLLGTREKQEKIRISKVKGRICFTCRLKGHLSQDCPKGNKYEPKVVNSISNVHDKSVSMILER